MGHLVDTFPAFKNHSLVLEDVSIVYNFPKQEAAGFLWPSQLLFSRFISVIDSHKEFTPNKMGGSSIATRQLPI